MKSKLVLNLLSTVLMAAGLLSFSVTQANEPGSQQAEYGLLNMTQEYSNYLVLAQGFDVGSEIRIMCGNEIFLEWSKAYLALLENANLQGKPISQDVLDAFANAYFPAFYNQPEYSQVFSQLQASGAPEVLSTVNGELIKQRKQNSVSDLVSNQLSLADAQIQVLRANLSLCMSPDFVSDVVKIGKIDDSKMPAPVPAIHWNVKWVPTPAGGLAPTVGQN